MNRQSPTTFYCGSGGEDFKSRKDKVLPESSERHIELSSNPELIFAWSASFNDPLWHCTSSVFSLVHSGVAEVAAVKQHRIANYDKFENNRDKFKSSYCNMGNGNKEKNQDKLITAIKKT